MEIRRKEDVVAAMNNLDEDEADETAGVNAEHEVLNFRPHPTTRRTAQYFIKLHSEDEPEWREATYLTGKAWDHAIEEVQS